MNILCSPRPCIHVNKGLCTLYSVTGATLSGTKLVNIIHTPHFFQICSPSYFPRKINYGGGYYILAMFLIICLINYNVFSFKNNHGLFP